MRGDARQSFERLRALRFGSHDADEDFRVAQVARDLAARHRHELRDARILRFGSEKDGDFLANRLRDAIGATMLGGHRGVRSESAIRACARTTPYGSTR